MSAAKTRPAATGALAHVDLPRHRVLNAMTVDVEDYFQVSAFEGVVSRDRWDSFESRICRNTERLLELFASTGVTATFFILGWVADRFPGLVGQIAARGHEIACHGYAHQLVYTLTPTEFRADVRRAKATLERACGVQVRGYRAPSYSITSRSLWAFDVLLQEGFAYDASVFPIRHDRYGIPDAPRHPYVVKRPEGELWELPGATVRFGGQNVPIGGGGYFRLFPYAWTRRAISVVNANEGRPVIFYLHPWEIDPGQPRLKGSLVSRFRHYQNLDKTEPRLRRLLTDFRFTSVRSLLFSDSIGGVPTPTTAAAFRTNAGFSGLCGEPEGASLSTAVRTQVEHLLPLAATAVQPSRRFWSRLGSVLERQRPT